MKISTDPAAKAFKISNLLGAFEIKLPKRGKTPHAHGNFRYCMAISVEDPSEYRYACGEQAAECLKLEKKGKCLLADVEIPYERRLKTRGWKKACFLRLKNTYELLLNEWFSLYSPLEDDPEDEEYKNKSGKGKGVGNVMVLGRRACDRHY